MSTETSVENFPTITYPLLQISLPGSAACLWQYTLPATGEYLSFAAPSFELNGLPLVASVAHWMPREDRPERADGVRECSFRGSLAEDSELSLEVIFQIARDSPVVRFCYVLHSTRARHLTKRNKQDSTLYFATSFAALDTVHEVRLAEFNEVVHSFCLSERVVESREFDNELSVIGPILAGCTAESAFLLAYEHGAQVPDAFLKFRLSSERKVRLEALKGSYYRGQEIGPDQPYSMLWCQVAGVLGDLDVLAAAYRSFILHHQSPNAESRRPYLFYNTWAFQERNKWWNQKNYLDSMQQEQILAEIEVAHRMGIEVFVLDTGWYEKTGDWRVNRARFPDGLKSIKARLDEYGMKLGLWFDPLAAAASSLILQNHRDCLLSWEGKVPAAHPIWESEDSHKLCLVSRYKHAFAEELIRLVSEVGVTYFKWDAISQYGCDDPGHEHGGPDCSAEERADCYAFELGRAMSWIVDKVCAACPEAIVDFDITEGGRCVGLGFLASGKYFLINNGPYSHNYDRPVPADGNVNLFFYPGPARAWICRTPLTFDKWIPSVLLLTHYLPDDPESSQWVNLASLVLGQNGIWGDLLGVSEEGIARIGSTLERYKQVQGDITQATLARTGTVGGSPEVYEKILAETGRGVVSFFAGAAGRYSYVTQTKVVPEVWHNEGVKVTYDAEGRACLDIISEAGSAKIIFFGATSQH